MQPQSRGRCGARTPIQLGRHRICSLLPPVAARAQEGGDRRLPRGKCTLWWRQREAQGGQTKGSSPAPFPRIPPPACIRRHRPPQVPVLRAVQGLRLTPEGSDGPTRGPRPLRARATLASPGPRLTWSLRTLLPALLVCVPPHTPAPASPGLRLQPAGSHRGRAYVRAPTRQQNVPLASFLGLKSRLPAQNPSRSLLTGCSQGICKGRPGGALPAAPPPPVLPAPHAPSPFLGRGLSETPFSCPLGHSAS